MSSSKTKRRRAVVLALIAFFCAGATTYVALDWKRVGGGFLAFLRGKGGPNFASDPEGGAGSSGIHHVAGNDTGHEGASLPRLVAADSRRRTADGAHGTGGGHPSDDDLFKYGDPAAGGIPPGSFIVAQNETPGGGESLAPSPAPVGLPVTSPAPAPGDAGGAAPGASNGGLNDPGLTNKPAGTPPAPPSAGNPPSSTPPSPPPSSTPASPPPVSTPVSSPPSSEPPPPASDPTGPTQSGTTDPGAPPPPSTPVPPVSAVPEASTTSMMALGALFLAVAAARTRRKS